MIKEALQYIIGLGNTRIEDIGAQKYSTQGVHLVQEACAKTLVVNSLTGLIDYLQSEFDGNNQLLVHVASPTEVNVYSHFTRDMTRNAFVQAKALLPQFPFGKFQDLEEFNIALQSMFVENEQRGEVLQIVGNVKDENVTNYGDDGVSQQVTAKAGIATVAVIPVPNPVHLMPYRTFIEVDQPESSFVFRMRTGPDCALFEADGGAWKNEAIGAVRDFLHESLQSRIDSDQIVLLA